MIRFKRIGHRLAASYAALLAVLLISSLLAGLQLQGIGAARQAMGASLDRLQDALVERSAASGQALTQRLDQAQLALALACVIGLVAGSLLAWRMALAISAPLPRATAFAGGVARGDLSVQLPIEGRDEIAALQGSLGGMQESLRSLVEQVRDSADHIQVASAESLREQALRLAEVVGRFQLGAANTHAPAPAQFAATPSLNGPPSLGKSVPPAHLAQSVVQRAKAAAHAASCLSVNAQSSH